MSKRGTAEDPDKWLRSLNEAYGTGFLEGVTGADHRLVLGPTAGEFQQGYRDGQLVKVLEPDGQTPQ